MNYVVSPNPARCKLVTASTAPLPGTLHSGSRWVLGLLGISNVCLHIMCLQYVCVYSSGSGQNSSRSFVPLKECPGSIPLSLLSTLSTLFKSRYFHCKHDALSMSHTSVLPKQFKTQPLNRVYSQPSFYQTKKTFFKNKDNVVGFPQS